MCDPHAFVVQEPDNAFKVDDVHMTIDGSTILGICYSGCAYDALDTCCTSTPTPVCRADASAVLWDHARQVVAGSHPIGLGACPQASNGRAGHKGGGTTTRRV